MKIRLVIFSYKNPPKKSFVMKILAPGNPKYNGVGYNANYVYDSQYNVGYSADYVSQIDWSHSNQYSENSYWSHQDQFQNYTYPQEYGWNGAIQY